MPELERDEKRVQVACVKFWWNWLCITRVVCLILQMKKNDALKLQEDPKMKANLDRKIKEVAINKDALESATAPTARNVPPYDSSATTPEHAYPLDKIILSGEWNYLLDILELVQGGLEVAPDTYPSFIRNRYNKLWEIQVSA